MSNKSIDLVISRDMQATSPDMLTNSCLRVETARKVLLAPGKTTTMNLTVHNTSGVGRIAHLRANYDHQQVKILIPDSEFYVAPDAPTVVYAIITPIQEGGTSTVSFDAH